jgi:hypothetical protein
MVTSLFLTSGKKEKKKGNVIVLALLGELYLGHINFEYFMNLNFGHATYHY